VFAEHSPLAFRLGCEPLPDGTVAVNCRLRPDELPDLD
jgi:hypothetical protein